MEVWLLSHSRGDQTELHIRGEEIGHYLNCRRSWQQKISTESKCTPRPISYVESCLTSNGALPAWLIFNIWFSGEVAGHWSASKAAFVVLKLVKIILGSRVTVTLSPGCSEGMRSDSLTSLVSDGALPFSGQVIWNWKWICFLLESVPLYYWKMPCFLATDRE